MSSMFPTFTRKSGWFTLTLPDSLITKFLLTKGGVGSFGFSHLFKASFSVFACFGSPGLVFLAVRGFPFLAPGSRFLVRRNTSRFSDILSDVVFGFSWFRVSSSTRKKVNLSKLEVFRCNSHEGDRKTCLTYFTYILSHQAETWYPKPNTTFPLSPHVQAIQDSLGFWIPNHGFRIPAFVSGNWILDSIC